METTESLPAEIRVVGCRSCRAPVFWAILPSGATCPIDAAPSGAGKYVIEAWGIASARCSVTMAVFDSSEHTADEPRFGSHFGTCPQASSHSRKGQR